METTFLKKIKHHIQAKLGAGLLVWIPLAVTFMVLKFLFVSIDSLLRPVIERTLNFSFPGLGILLTIILLYITGVLTTNIFGKYLVHLGERILLRLPFVRTIYQSVKQIMQTLSMPSEQRFKKVVIIEYPRHGLRAIGFVTGATLGANNQRFVSVFIPTSPNPTSGMLELIPEEDVEEAKISVEEALKIIMSGGIIASEKLSR